MNRAYLRPPLPLYRIGALLALPLVWLSIHVALGRLGPLQNLYWSDYLRTTFLSPSFSLDSLLPSFGPTTARAPKPEFKILVSAGPAGRERPVTVDGRGIPLDAHLAVIPMADKNYNPWLRRNIYGGRPGPGFLVVPIFAGLLLVSLLCGGAYFWTRNGIWLFVRSPDILADRSLSRRASSTAEYGVMALGFMWIAGVGASPKWFASSAPWKPSTNSCKAITERVRPSPCLHLLTSVRRREKRASITTRNVSS